MLEMMLTRILKKPNEPGNEPGLEIDPGVFHKLLAADGAMNDVFGYSVAVSGDGSTIVVGAYGDDDKGKDSGSVYIFTKQANGSYAQTQKLVPSDGTASDEFGWSVAVSSDGSTIVVGAYGDDDKGKDSGSVYIFTKQPNGSYLQSQKLVASDGAATDKFGWSVSISGDGSIIVVGARFDDDKGTNSGSAYVFTKQLDGSYLETHKLVPTDGSAQDYFGNSVSVSGDGSTIVVGAFWDDDKGTNSGSAYVFTKQVNDSYLQSQKLVASDGATDDRFGNSVAISNDGTTIVVGAYYDDDKGKDSGSVYIFTKQVNGSYLQLQKLVASDGAESDQFGISVAVSQTSVVVGAYYDDDKGKDSGSAYIFTKQDDGSYLQTHKLVATDGAASDYFGVSVAISNTSVVVGAQNHLTKGAVYVY